MHFTHVAVVMPAYNEVEGIRGFLDEIRSHLAPFADRITFVVADDRSTDGTPDALAELADVEVSVQDENRGHGPTALAAYREGLALSPSVIVHVDGDGQFLGEDFTRLLSAWEREQADVVHGVRRGRTDPWYRRMLSGAVAALIAVHAGRRIPDVNTPLRAYRPEALRVLIDAVPADAVVPHVHFSLAEARGGFAVRYVPVRSIPRRGESASGTMWGAASRISLPPARLRAFVRVALGEVWTWSLRPGAPLRAVRRPADALEPFAQ
ncbi:glycosyltransferase family 2 protein [Microbacterium sp. 3J1]|uniref:glycosyltransferase family 2 protein n=1 Tax=Microbacterium sp. 3J1 TaxID=861269 RepID=UPI000B0BBF69|nr:glycosyltransferase family 2 protein [Microbacterium sp. 3J1]